MRAIYSRHADLNKGTLPVELGGTGTRDPGNLRNSLNLVTEADKDVVGGVVTLDAQGKVQVSRLPITSQGVNVNGTFDVYVNNVVVFEITDFDSFKNYNISFSSGTFVRENALITYTAPATAQSVTMSIGGREIDFQVELPQPAKPTILSPVSGNANQTQNPSFLASGYSYIGGNVVHKDTSWQIASDVDFTTIVAESLNDTVNKTTWTLTSVNLPAASTFFVRVRYRDNNNLSGKWSDTVQFTTKTVFAPTVEEAKIVAPDRMTYDYFGGHGDNRAIAMDGSGNRIVIGAPWTDYSGFTDQGSLYVFIRNNGTWTLEQRIDITDMVTNDGFGESVDMDDSGTRIVANAYGYTGSESNQGRAFVFTRSGSTWTRERIFENQTPTNSHYGVAVAINPDGNRVAIGNNARSVDVYRRSGSTWTLDDTLTAVDAGGNDDGDFGGKPGCLAFDKAADRLAIGAATGGNVSFSGFGAVYVFLRTGTSWAQEAKVVGSLGNQTLFGWVVDMDDAGTRFVTGLRNIDRAIVFLRTGVTWAQEAVLVKTGADVGNQQFGMQVAINKMGDIIAVSAPNGDNFPTLSDSGYVNIYRRSGVTWSLLTTLRASDEQSQFVFGLSMHMSSDGNRLIAATPLQTIGGVIQAGAVYAFS